MGSLVFCDLPNILRSYNVAPKGIVQVGAHTGEELHTFIHAGFNPIHLIEPNPLVLPKLHETIRNNYIKSPRMPAIYVHPFAIDTQRGELLLHHYPRTQDASILSRQDIPSPTTASSVVRSCRLSDLPISQCNVLVIDVQGAELTALKSLLSLSQFDLLIIEIDRDNRHNGSSYQDILAFLASNNLHTGPSYDHGHNPHVQDCVFSKHKL